MSELTILVDKLPEGCYDREIREKCKLLKLDIGRNIFTCSVIEGSPATPATGRHKDCPLKVKGEGFEVGEIVEFHINGEFWHYVKIIGEPGVLGQIVDEEGEPEQEPEIFHYENLRKVSE